MVEERLNNAKTVNYTYGDDLLSQTRNGTTNIYHYDGLGSTRALSDNTGAITDSYDYEAFGETLNMTGTTINSYLYAGEQFDQGLEQYYLRARYYDQGVGRFTQQDTWMGNNSDPITLHKYLYGNADPINHTDPTGKFSLGSVGAAINTIGTLANIASTVVDIFQISTGEKEFSAKEFGLNIILSKLPIKTAARLSRKLCRFLPKNSFIEGTLVHTARGLILIENIQIGDFVLSLNELTTEVEYKPVTNLIRNSGNYDLVKIVYETGETITSTNDHLFYVLSKGWITAGELRPGDASITENGLVFITEVSEFSKLATVYNFTVQDNHNYYVSSENVLVHNESIYHYTDGKGYNAIRSGGTQFTFKPSRPKRAGNPKAVYFTMLPPFDPKLAVRTSTSNAKIQFFFSFDSSYVENLKVLTPVFKLYSKDKVVVPRDAVTHGPNPFQQACKKK